MNSAAAARREKSRTSSIAMSGSPKATLPSTVSEKRNTSCVAVPMPPRSCLSFHLRTSQSSTRISPEVTS